MSNTLLMLCIPFAGLLLCIAVMPLVKPEWWEKHQAHAVILWSLLFAIPFALFYGAPKAVETPGRWPASYGAARVQSSGPAA